MTCAGPKDCWMRLDRVIVVDWSANSRPKRGKDSIWIGGDGPPRNPATRAAAIEDLTALTTRALAAGERLLIGVDFPLGYPAGFAAGLTGQASALAVWDWLAARVQDGPDNANNRFAVAAQANAAFDGLGPFWGWPAVPGVPMRGRDRHGSNPEDLRQTDRQARGAQSAFKLSGAGSVGSQALLGIARLAGLRRALAPHVAVWPFEPPGQITLAEVFPTLIDAQVRRACGYPCRDAAQVDLLARAMTGVALPPVPPIAVEEGWILRPPC